MRLWEREDVRGLLDPKEMLVARILDANGLPEFLGRAQQQEFSFDEEWARILSLEITLRGLEENGARLVS